MKRFAFLPLLFLACDSGSSSTETLRVFECPPGCVCQCVDPGTSSSSSSSSGSDSSGDASGGSSSTGASDPLEALSDDFDGDLSAWTVFVPEDSDRIAISSGGLELEPSAGTAWYNSWTTTHVGKFLPTGTNFMVTSEISVTSLDGSSTHPGGWWRLGGLSVRSADGSTDNVHLAIGRTNSNLGIRLEDKSTDLGVSDIGQTAWASNTVVARVCRVGDTFQVLGSTDGVTFTVYRTVARPDMGDVYAGPSAYAWPNNPDLRARYEYVEFASITDLSDCL